MKYTLLEKFDDYRQEANTTTLTPIEACKLAYNQLKKVKLTSDVQSAINELRGTINEYDN